MGRDLPSVLQAIKNVVPQDFPSRDALFERFNTISHKYRWTAPWLYPKLWDIVAITLANYIGDPIVGWKETVVAIIRDEEDFVNYLKKDGETSG